MVSDLATVVINSKGARRLKNGHVWIFESDVLDDSAAGDGDLVWVAAQKRSKNISKLGLAFYNSRSLIRLRLVSRRMVLPDKAYWKKSLESAISLRSQLGFCKDQFSACRLVYSEADRIPGLIVDKYDDVLVLQTLIAGSDKLLDTWVELLTELFQPRAIVERNDSNSRKLEGMDTRSGVIAGRLDGPVEIREAGIRLLVDPLEGQKTGYFLDQCENRSRVAHYAHGRCLDVFCYQGGFGLQLAKGGAEEVTVVDQSDKSLEICLASARLNGLKLQTAQANAFDFLRTQQAEKQIYDVIVLDPPAFAKNRAALERASRGYKEINLRAMKLLAEGGILVTSSCSYHMQADLFEKILLEAGQDAGRTLQVLERRSQSRDHPERLGFPESHYLKCIVLRVL